MIKRALNFWGEMMVERAVKLSGEGDDGKLSLLNCFEYGTLEYGEERCTCWAERGGQARR
jgi:hypothetical protein